MNASYRLFIKSPGRISCYGGSGLHSPDYKTTSTHHGIFLNHYIVAQYSRGVNHRAIFDFHTANASTVSVDSNIIAHYAVVSNASVGLDQAVAAHFGIGAYCGKFTDNATVTYDGITSDNRSLMY